MLSLMPFNRNGLQRRGSDDFVDFYNMIDDFFNNDLLSSKSLRSSGFKVDVKDNPENYVVEAELPGFNKEDIKLDFEDGKLLISAEHKEENNEEKENYIHRERKMCSMQRVIYLKDVKPEAISAQLENGVLVVEVPKAEQITNKMQIEIK